MKEIKSVKTEMNDLNKSIEFNENVLQEKFQKSRIKKIYEYRKYIQLDPEYVHNKLIDKDIVIKTMRIS